MKNIRTFSLKIVLFLVVKLSIYLNRTVFVMDRANSADTDQDYKLIYPGNAVIMKHTVPEAPKEEKQTSHIIIIDAQTSTNRQSAEKPPGA